jgi:hypothetical protein
MKINVDEALKIFQKYGDEEVPIIYLADFYLNTGKNMFPISKGMKFNTSHYDALKQAKVSEIDVIFSEKLFAKLVTNFGGIYRQPEGKKNVIELDRLIDTLETANAVTKRKRTIISLTEQYKKNSLGGFDPILNFGERLSIQRWNQVKVNLARNAMIEYRLDEGGILIFFLLNSSDPQYSQKFMQFTELVTLIVESKKAGVTVYADFNAETDVYSCNNKLDLLKTYNESRASLIIIGEDMNEEYKSALSQLKSYDRYAKMMMIKSPDPTQKVAILNQVKNVYGKKLWLEE